jgi:ABC-2 type transport system permease protein
MMGRSLRLILLFIRASMQQELAYRTNFVVTLLYSLLNFISGVLAIGIIFGQVESVQGWTFVSTLAILGIYLTLNALRDLVVGPSLESLAGMDGDIWTGKFDFLLLQPVDTQFLASVRHWRPFALFDLVLGGITLGIAVGQMQGVLGVVQLLLFLAMLAAGFIVLYAILLAFAGLVFWNPALLYTWIFNALFQMARYPVSLYPSELRFILTWIVPVGVMTTLPAEALLGTLTPANVAAGISIAAVACIAASLLFRNGLRRYVSASS